MKKNEASHPKNLLADILKWTVELLEAESGEIYLFNPEKQNLNLSIAFGMNEDLLGAELKSGEGLAGKVFEQQETIFIDDYQFWEGRSEKFGPAPDNKAEVGIPLRWQGQMIGALCIVSDQQHKLSPADLKTIAPCSNLVAAAIENHRLYRNLSVSLVMLKQMLEQDIAEQTQELTRQISRISIDQSTAANDTHTLSVDEMLSKLMDLRATQKVLSSLASVKLQEPTLTDLTQREIDVLHLIAIGLSNKEIAGKLNLAISTVKFHVSSILSKLNFSDRTQAALWAARMGMAKEKE